MAKEIFDQALFIGRVDAARKKMGLQQKDICAAVNLDPNAYPDWRNGKRRLNLDQVVTICKKVELRPAWALWEEGPKTDREASEVWEARQILGPLLTAKLAAAPALQPGDSPTRSLHLQLSDKELLEGLGALLTWTRLHKYELPQFGALLPLVVFLTELGASRGLNVPADRLAELAEGISGKDQR